VDWNYLKSAHLQMHAHTTPLKTNYLGRERNCWLP